MKGARLIAAALVVMANVSLTPTLAQQRLPGRVSERGPLALVGGTLIDGTGNPAVRNSVVLIRGDRIERVGTAGAITSPPARIPTKSGARYRAMVVLSSSVLLAHVPEIHPAKNRWNSTMSAEAR